MDFAEGRVMWMITGVISSIATIFFAVLVPTLIHLVFFSAGDVIFIDTPFISNALFIAAATLFSIFCFLMFSQKKKVNAAGFGILLLSIAIGTVSLFNYIVFKDDVIMVSDALELSSTKYAWEDVDSAVVLMRNDDVEYDSLMIQFNDGEEIEYRRGGPNGAEYNTITAYLQAQGIYPELVERP